jgi:hypothetical protein
MQYLQCERVSNRLACVMNEECCLGIRNLTEYIWKILVLQQEVNLTAILLVSEKFGKYKH